MNHEPTIEKPNMDELEGSQDLKIDDVSSIDAAAEKRYVNIEIAVARYTITLAN